MTHPPWPPGYSPPIKQVMTPFPHSIESDASLADAARTMVEHDVRHLPVREEGELVGLVSERDLRSPRIGVPHGEGAPTKSVREVMTRPPFVVDLDTPLSEVLHEMAERFIGCALVTKSGHLAGIFTTVDACRLFARQLGRGESADDIA